MNQPFAVFDIDGTLIRWQLYHALADALAHLGYFDPEAFEAVRQARLSWKQRSHINSYKDYEHQLIKAYEQILTNLKVSQFNEAVDLVFEEYKDQVYTYTRDLIRKLKAKDYLLFAISGSQTEIVNRIADYYGFDDFVGTRYMRVGNRFTGKMVLANSSKHLVLEKMVRRHAATQAGSLAVGDSESDISMLESVEHPIVFNPTQRLLSQAKISGWPVIIERKNVIYKLETQNGKYVLA